MAHDNRNGGGNVGSESIYRALLVAPHVPAVALDVRCQDGRQLAFGALSRRAQAPTTLPILILNLCLVQRSTSWVAERGVTLRTTAVQTGGIHRFDGS